MVFDRAKKRCSVCGCLMDPDSEFDMCEVCIDELFGDELYEEVGDCEEIL